MGCGCDERKAELAARGKEPLIGKQYTPVDAAQWALMKSFDKILGR